MAAQLLASPERRRVPVLLAGWGRTAAPYPWRHLGCRRGFDQCAPRPWRRLGTGRDSHRRTGALLEPPPGGWRRRMPLRRLPRARAPATEVANAPRMHACVAFIFSLSKTDDSVATQESVSFFCFSTPSKIQPRNRCANLQGEAVKIKTGTGVGALGVLCKR